MFKAAKLMLLPSKYCIARTVSLGGRRKSCGVSERDAAEDVSPCSTTFYLIGDDGGESLAAILRMEQRLLATLLLLLLRNRIQIGDARLHRSKFKSISGRRATLRGV